MEKDIRYKYDFMVRHVFIRLCSYFWPEESWRGRAQLSWAGKELLLQDGLATSITATHRITDWISYWLDGWRTPSSPAAPSTALCVWGPCTPIYLHHSRCLLASFTFPPSAPWPYLVFSFWYESFSCLWLNHFSSLLVLFLSDVFIVGLCHHSLWEQHTASYFTLVWNRITTVTVYKHTKWTWTLETRI